MPSTQNDVEFGCWLSASDHAALTQMARDSGMTQAQVVSRLIGMVGAVRGLERFQWVLTADYVDRLSRHPNGQYVIYSDLTDITKL